MQLFKTAPAHTALDAVLDAADQVILGKGHLQCSEVFDAMVRANFPADGALSLEYEENPKDPIADIRECVAIAKKAMDEVKS